MPLSTPKFWYKPVSLMAVLLLPITALYALLTMLDRLRARPKPIDIPVIAVGNIVAGGGGKTPTVIALIRMLKSLGYEPHVVSRGYGRSDTQLLKVDAEKHTAEQVGDEPLLLSQHAPCWVHKNRYIAAKAAQQAGATMVIMDDGLQHKYLRIDFGLLCVSAADGLGNGWLLPSGPMRQTIASLRAKINATLVIGDANERSTKQLMPFQPRYSAKLVAQDWQVQHVEIYAFAAIARPQRFFDLLEQEGATLVGKNAYPDHSFFSEADLKRMQDAARAQNASLATTAKDHARLPAHWKPVVRKLEVGLSVPEEAALTEQLQEILTAHYNKR